MIDFVQIGHKYCNKNCSCWTLQEVYFVCVVVDESIEKSEIEDTGQTSEMDVS